MPKQTPLLRSFNGGEWSPLMAGRVDLDKYSSSCRLMRNFLPTPQGTAVARSGTAFVVEAASVGTPSALYAFQFSDVQSCVLEFGDKVLRFITENGLLVDAAGNPYTVATPYAAADVANIRYAQKNDILYVFCPGYRPQKLSRLGATNWTIADVDFKDGPYLDINYDNNRASPQSIGGAPMENWTWTPTVVNPTGNATYDQTGTATWNFSSAKALTGYQIILPKNNSIVTNSTIYSSKDMAPSTWVLSGSNDNSTWTVVDTQTTYVDYSNNCSGWIPLYGGQSYKYYKLEVSQTYINQEVPPNIGTMLFTSTSDADFTIDFDNTTNINFNAGFKATDAGRDMRLQRSDGMWVPVTITTYLSPTSVACRCLGAPLLDTSPTTYWRLGLYGDTNGYPTCGAFFSERLWMGGVNNYPDTLCASQVGAYETMQPDDPRSGAVSDSDAINITLETRSQILWINSDDRGLVMGTSSGEWTVQSGQYTNYTTASVITPTSILARNPTQRGSAPVDAVRIDHQTLYVQRSGREIRALAYSFQIDGYDSSSLSTQATHLGQPAIIKLAYQADPYSNVWALRSDGMLLSLTYMQDEQVEGWAQHDVGGIVESITCIPSPDSQQDALWLAVRRTVNGSTVRYIERLLRSWDFNMTSLDAAFVDCCTADASLSQTLSAPHLAGEQVYGVIDGKTAFGPLLLDSNGNAQLPAKPSTRVVVGLPMEAKIITQRLEAGAQIGTAQGKIKRTARTVFRLWATGSGRIGTPATLNQPDEDLTSIGFTSFDGVMDEAEVLHSFDYEFILPPGYDRDGSMVIARGAADLFPLNVVCATAWVETEDSA